MHHRAPTASSAAGAPNDVTAKQPSGENVSGGGKWSGCRSRSPPPIHGAPDEDGGLTRDREGLVTQYRGVEDLLEERRLDRQMYANGGSG